MRAVVECGVCGGKLIVDTCRPCNPEELGWREMPIHEASFAACMEGRTEVLPICPECQDFHARIAEIFDPMRGKE